MQVVYQRNFTGATEKFYFICFGNWVYIVFHRNLKGFLFNYTIFCRLVETI